MIIVMMIMMIIILDNYDDASDNNIDNDDDDNTCPRVAIAQSCENHVQYIWVLMTCNMSRATCYKGTVQLLSLTGVKSQFFLL